jgi:hypothetical protein
VIAMTLSGEEFAIVRQARDAGLLEQEESLAYLPGWLCSVLSIALVPLSLGFSLVFVPIVWIAQHDRTATRIARLRHQLCSDPPRTTALSRKERKLLLDCSNCS